MVNLPGASSFGEWRYPLVIQSKGIGASVGQEFDCPQMFHAAALWRANILTLLIARTLEPLSISGFPRVFVKAGYEMKRSSAFFRVPAIPGSSGQGPKQAERLWVYSDSYAM